MLGTTNKLFSEHEKKRFRFINGFPCPLQGATIPKTFTKGELHAVGRKRTKHRQLRFHLRRMWQNFLSLSSLEFFYTHQLVSEGLRLSLH